MDNPETLGTHDTGQRHWVHMTQDRDTGYTGHRTETLGTHDTGQRHWVHMTQDRDTGYT